MWTDGRPRFWVGWWDTPHLALPVVTLSLLIWLAVQPRPKLPPRPATPATATDATPAQPTGNTTRPTVLAPPIVDEPVTGSRFRIPPAGRLMAEVRGRSMEPGLRAALFYTAAGGRETFLTETTTDATGRFRFGLGTFPQGAYTLRVATYAPDGRRSVSAPFQISVTAR